MNDPGMGFFPKILHSVAGFGKYRYFIRQRPGKAVVYLLLLSLILGAVGLIPFLLDFNNALSDFIAGFDKSVPDFTFENGRLSVEGDMPIILGEGSSTVIIDTSGGTDESVLDNYDNAVLITSDRMIQKNYANKQVTNFSLMQGVKLDREGVKSVLPLLKSLSVLILIFGAVFFVCAKFISALIVSLAGLIINAARGTRLLYGDVFKISVYSLTLPLLLGTLIDLTGVAVPYLSLIFYLIAIIYVWGAFNSIKKDMEEPPLPPAE
jgi:hypothetical protein